MLNCLMTNQFQHCRDFFVNLSRLIENAGSADVELTAAEVKALDDALDNMEMSAVYGGAPIKEK